MIPVEQALSQILSLARPLEGEEIDLRQGLGRRLARAVTAGLTQPPFAASAMDGYAVSVPPAPGQRFRVIGQAQAGRGFDRPVGAGEAVRIFTGAPVPQGASHVVLQEVVTREGEDILLGSGTDPATNIRARGQDFAQGVPFAPDRRLTPADLGLLAAMNAARLHVHRRPVVAILSTGDELVPPGETPGPDQIIASSAMAIAGLVQAEGGIPRILPIARDQIDHLRAALSLTAGADLIVTLGGASVGDHDLIGNRAGELGLTLDFWKIALRPGKPMMAGRFGAVPLLGLPGNPVSAYVCAVLFLLPLLRAFQGDGDPAPKPVFLPTLGPLAANGPRRHYMRAVSEPGGIRALPDQDSALTSVLAEADALLIRPEAAAAAAPGELVPVLQLPR